MKSSWRSPGGGSSVARNAEVEPCGAVFCAWWITGSTPIRTFHTVSEVAFSEVRIHDPEYPSPSGRCRALFHRLDWRSVLRACHAIGVYGPPNDVLGQRVRWIGSIREERIVSTPQLELPDDFECESYEAISSLVGPLKDSHELQWIEFATAWQGVTNCFRACAEHDEAFTRSIKKKDAPPQPERYYQERALFGFFINGLSVVESTCYGLYAIGSMLDEVYFPIKKARNKRAISPERTADRFRTTFPNEGISRTLNVVVESQEYDDWKEYRNILAHRGSPGRKFQRTIGSGADTHGDALWLNGIPLNASTTPSRRAWLADTLQMLLREAHSFCTKEF